ncbi:MAG: hypothetical protein WAM39_09385 [Bryobacteraceae bacterium]
MRLRTSRTDAERGSAVIEFMFSTLIWVPLLLGVIGIGTELMREIQVTEMGRDAARMYAYGVDFTQPSSQQLILQVAPNLGLAQTGGNGAIILSTIKVISAADCQAGGFNSPPNYPGCTNFNHPVFINQILIGNSAYKSSFDNPNPPPTVSGAVPQMTTLTSTSDRTPLITQLLPSLSAGQLAYVGEVFVNNSDLAWTGFGGSVIASQSIF